MGFGLKAKKNRKLVLGLLLGVLFAATMATVVVLSLLGRIDYVLAENPVFEINSENEISALFAEIPFGTLENSDFKLNTTEVGEKSQEVTIISQLGTKRAFNVVYAVIDTIAPEITGDDELTLEAGGEFDILGHYTSADNSEREVAMAVEGEYNLSVAGEYKIFIKAVDQSGNESRKMVTLKVAEPPSPVDTATANGAPYYIEVNRQQNVVIVYSRDETGDYTNIVKIFVASTGAPGSETPLGIFTVADRYEALYLVGEVWGHYAVRINGPYFFHSVPYFTKGSPWDNLEYLEYNKLGNSASAGCVRLAAADAKWIYDNIPYGTQVKIYDSDTLPAGVVKPSSVKIDENSPNRGWDPTDADPNNPWRTGA